MKNIIVYTSQTGFTEKYANLLGEKINGEVLTLKDAKKKPDSFFADADSIVYAGWLMAGKVTGSDWMVKRLSAFSGKMVWVKKSFLPASIMLSNAETGVLSGR